MLEIKLVIDFSPIVVNLLSRLTGQTVSRDPDDIPAAGMTKDPPAGKSAYRKKAPVVDLQDTEDVPKKKKENGLAPTADRIRELVAYKSEAGKTKAIKTLLGKFDATSVTSLAEESYQEFYDELKTL